MSSVWKRIKYIKTPLGAAPRHATWAYELELPVPLADWDVFDYWERERTEAITTHLTRGDVLFDVGAEHGWLSVVYSHTVGPENMVLFEPSPYFWPNIRQTWERNTGAMPRATVQALVGGAATYVESPFGWPAASDGPLAGGMPYASLNHGGDIPIISINNFVESYGIVPDAITIDVEGAELQVISGAIRTLRQHHPKLFISVHPDLMDRDYGQSADELRRTLEDLGYERTLLAVDHESHEMFL